MPNISDMLQSKYLRREDVMDEDITTTITGIAKETMTDIGRNSEKEKWVVQFATCKPLVLNTTNIKTLAQMYGNDADAWVGKTVILFYDPNVRMGTQITGGIRFRLPPKKKTKKEETDVPFDDEIPFGEKS